MRIDPVAPPYTAKVQALFDRLPASWAPPFRHFAVLARDVRLLRAYLQGSVGYLQPSHITLRQREVFLLRVTGRCRNAFEWCLRVHYFADVAGISETQLRASVYGAAADASGGPTDRLLIRLADELHDTVLISDDLWTDLQAVFTAEAILQLILLAGHYRTSSYLALGLRIPVESRVKRLFPDP